ncbi:hypothetical protein ALO_06190 [Acetonema longum DSM 6540]|uniref:Uncharacterized protein n=1 Tax=Acetonema longum DSM 6540 TaxID=1009370 RepID=F7NGQ0_9FIRM|nr:hypothetical protein ALO_06190 [Acetonema longum DSM 6540]
MQRPSLFNTKIVVPCTGTWIETSGREPITDAIAVVPCTGTWIETANEKVAAETVRVVPCTGTWIETKGNPEYEYRQKGRALYGHVD